MKRRSDKLLLEDMLSAIDQIEKYLEGISFEDFCRDQMRQDAVVRRLEVIGEAARFLSEISVAVILKFLGRTSSE